MAAQFYRAIQTHWRTPPPPSPTAADKVSAPPDGWPELQRLLRQCRGVYRELPRDVVTSAYCGGPLLGNGEIGATIGGDAASQTIYLNRLDFWNQGLGGITISAATSHSMATRRR